MKLYNSSWEIIFPTPLIKNKITQSASKVILNILKAE